jgi:hypothetical protein
MFHFFVPESVADRVAAARKAVVLTGGFSGCWNFGDLLQLAGAMEWHRKIHNDAVLLPTVDLANVRTATALERLIRWLHTDVMIYLYAEQDDQAPFEIRIGGQRFRRFERGPERIMLHVYGGGFLNRFWATWQLRMIEDLHHTIHPQVYLISGQQIDPHVADRVAAHIESHRPRLVGCRDEQSVEALARHGVAARFSGDDAWEALQACAEDIKHGTAAVTGEGERSSFGLHLNLSWYVHAEDVAERNGTVVGQRIRSELVDLFAALQARFGSDARPLVVLAFPDPRQEVADSLCAIEKTGFTRIFPHVRCVDLVGLLEARRFAELGPWVENLALFISCSYHTALLFTMLRIPTYLLAFNQYYAQKRASLGLTHGGAADFRTVDLEERLRAQSLWVEHVSSQRQEWLDLLSGIVVEAFGG